MRKHKFKVHLASCGNPDHGENPDKPLPGVSDTWKVADSLAVASRACRSYITLHGLGSGNWAGGQIETMDGKPIGRVSYNGRVWDLNDREINT